jgi:DNA polymerase-3 subunit alpha
MAVDLPVTQFDKDDVEAIGLVKFDFLGLRTLTIIQWAVPRSTSAARARARPRSISTCLPLDDVPSYQMFARGDTVAVFQFESAGMQRLLKDAKPDRFEDLIALVSLYRPGPMELIPSFCARKHGRETDRLPRSARRTDPERDLRHHGLPGAGDADGADRRAATRSAAPICCAARWARRSPRR